MSLYFGRWVCFPLKHPPSSLVITQYLFILSSLCLASTILTESSCFGSLSPRHHRAVMRSVTLRILGLLGVTAAGFAAPHGAASDVVELTEETFYEFTEEHELLLAHFYLPWCPYSKMLAPQFELAATELKTNNIPLVKIDCIQEKDLCAEYEIFIYPSMKVFRGPKSHKTYDESRRAKP